MPRLPGSAKEETARAKRRLTELYTDVFPGQDPSPFFETIAQHLNIPNEVSFRIAITEACAAYRPSANDLPREVIREARRLVGLIRREVKSIDKLRQQYSERLLNQRGTFEGNLRDFSREVSHPFKAFLSLCTRLRALVGSESLTNLDEIIDCVEWTRLKVSTPLILCHSAAALQDLDYILKNWSAVTRAQKGKRMRNQALDVLIERLAACYEKVTGEHADTGKRFKGFVEIVVEQVPLVETSVKTEDDQDKLRKRVERLLRSTPSRQPRDFSF